MHFSMVKKSTQKDSNEFAVFQTGGKQYKVAVGDTLHIEKVDSQKVGETIVFDKVLLVDNGTDTTIGTPFIAGAKVQATLDAQGRNKKVIVMKYKPKSRYKKTNGHRQPYTQITITAIQ